MLSTFSSRTAPSSAAGHSPFPDPTVIARSINLLYGPDSASPQTPTSDEVNRQTFTARFVGTYTIGPPRFADRSLTLHASSKNGGSNQFRAGKFQLVLFPPASASAQPTPGNPYANVVTGVASLFPQNYLQTGGLLVLDLSGKPASDASPRAMPTHLNWTYDSFASSGTYAGLSLDFHQGAGVLDIKYIPDRHPQAGTLGSGRFVVAIQGVINTSQITSTISQVNS